LGNATGNSSPAAIRCERVIGRLIRNVPVRDVQCDEIWGFIRKKEAHKALWEENDATIGDAYCFVAIERKTELALNFALGRRDQAEQLRENPSLQNASYIRLSEHVKLKAANVPSPQMIGELVDELVRESEMARAWKRRSRGSKGVGFRQIPINALLAHHRILLFQKRNRTA
jgi:hypothetical protein